MSPRAAWRLDSLGFSAVYDYVPGKADWFAAGMPREGRQAHTPRVADIADRSVPTCRLGEWAADVRRRIGTTHVCVVLNDVDVVLGLVRADTLAAEPDARVDELMQEGPPTFRPDVGAGELPSYLRKRRVARAVVTTSDGKFVGLLRMDEFDGTGGHSRA